MNYIYYNLLKSNKNLGTQQTLCSEIPAFPLGYLRFHTSVLCTLRSVTNASPHTGPGPQEVEKSKASVYKHLAILQITVQSNLTKRERNLYCVCLLFHFTCLEINCIVLPENPGWWQVENQTKSSFLTGG